MSQWNPMILHLLSLQKDIKKTQIESHSYLRNSTLLGFPSDSGSFLNELENRRGLHLPEFESLRVHHLSFQQLPKKSTKHL